MYAIKLTIKFDKNQTSDCALLRFVKEQADQKKDSAY